MNIENLIFLTKMSAKKMEDLTVKLDQAPERRVSALLNAIDREATLLSSVVGKLSQHIDEIRETEQVALEDAPVVFDENLLRIVHQLRAYEQPVCAVCGGLKAVDNEELAANDNGPQNGAFLRARERADEVQDGDQNET